MTMPPDLLDFSSPDAAERSRQTMRQWCTSNLYFLCTGVLGMDRLRPHVHRLPCAFLDACPAPGTGTGDSFVFMMPRDYFKSSLASIGKVIQDILQNPHAAILIVNEKEDNAKSFVRAVRTQFEKNKKLRWLFPELIPDINHVRWSDSAIEIKRPESGYQRPEATVEAIGVTGTVVSRHYDVIILDDLVGKSAAASPAVMRQAHEWLKLADHLFADQLTKQLRVVGTRWAYRDIYGVLLDREGTRRFVLPSAISPEDHEKLDEANRSANGPIRSFELEGEPNLDAAVSTFPEAFPMRVQKELKNREGSYWFSCMMLLDPTNPENCHFKESDLGTYEIEGGKIVPLDDAGNPTGDKLDRRDLYVCGMLDPASSKKTASSKFGMVFWAMDNKGRKFLLDAWAKRSASPDEVVKALVARYKRFRPSRVGFEDFSAFDVYMRTIKKECAEQGVNISLIPILPGNTDSKDTRIMDLEGPMESGEVYIRRSQTEFIEEVTTFTPGSDTPKDLLDATYYCFRDGGLLRYPDGRSTRKGRREHWHERQLERHVERVDPVTGYGF